MLSKTCAELIEYLKEILHSPQFINRHKQSEKDFTRTRILPFQTLFLYFINFIKGSYQDELDHFFKALFRLDVPITFVTKMALSLARKKLKYDAFIEFNQHLLDFFYDHFKNTKTWNGFNLLAIDGSTLKLFKYKEIREHFGILKPNKGPACVMARVSQMFDVLNKVTIEAIISPYRIGERDLFHSHMFNLLPNDLLLLDRGYPAYWIFNLIMSQDGHFCARISNQWKIVQNFVESGAREILIDLQPSYQSKKECDDMGLDTRPLRLRLIRVELDTGEIEVLITSLTNEQKFPHEIFMDLYHKRWPVEVDYLFMKQRIEIGNFSGKSSLSVYQDFHAKVLAKNLTWILSSPAQVNIENEETEKKHEYQLNMTQAISKSKDTLFLLFERPREIIVQLIQDIHAVFMAATEPIRPGRKFKRKHKINKREHYMNYKPCR
ncbi:MAG: IS4 family transposase [Desulfobacteraceae bacterium]|nr:IS4 family transposase [Desulfobacteraceae bacterium]